MTLQLVLILIFTSKTDKILCFRIDVLKKVQNTVIRFLKIIVKFVKTGQMLSNIIDKIFVDFFYFLKARKLENRKICINCDLQIVKTKKIGISGRNVECVETM